MYRFTRVAGLTVALALSTAAAAQAHPGFYSVDARVANTYEEQTVTVTGGAGTFKPSANAASVAFDATAAQVEAALWADPAIGYDNIDVTGPAGGPYVLRWTGTLAGKVVAPIAPSGSGGATATVSQGQEGGTPVTFASDPTGSTMATVRQYVLVNDGYTYGYTETNGTGGRGMLNLKFLPGAYRAAPMAPAAWITYPATHTGIQVHATCVGVPALDSPANILTIKTGDPFYGYVPWQKTTAGVGDKPAEWIPAVKAMTNGLPGAPAGGVDLSALDTVADFTTACTNLGGTYFPADTRSNAATALVSDAVAPLNTQIMDLTSQTAALTGQNADLTSQTAALTSQKNAVDAELTTANGKLATALADAAAAKALLANAQRKLTAALSGKVSLTGATTVKLTGPAGASVRVRTLLSQVQATKLHLKSLVIGQKVQKLGANGTATARVPLGALAKVKARKASRSAISIEAVALNGVASVSGS